MVVAIRSLCGFDDGLSLIQLIVEIRPLLTRAKKRGLCMCAIHRWRFSSLPIHQPTLLNGAAYG